MSLCCPDCEADQRGCTCYSDKKRDKNERRRKDRKEDVQQAGSVEDSRPDKEA